MCKLSSSNNNNILLIIYKIKLIALKVKSIY